MDTVPTWVIRSMNYWHFFKWNLFFFKQQKEISNIKSLQFFFSYSHTTKYDEVLKKDVSCPIFTLHDQPMFTPIGACPSQIDTKEELIALVKQKGYPEETLDTETFDKFLGFSYNTVCLDETGLWDFASDTKQQAIISLYGIWVSE